MQFANTHVQMGTRRRQGGVTLFELLISVSILAIMASVSMVSWVGYQRAQALDVAARNTMSALREAQGNAIARRDGTGDSTSDEWGVHIVNGMGSNSTLELFAGSTYTGSTIIRSVNFGSRIELTAPGEGLNFDFIYAFRSGKLTSGTSLDATCPKMMTGNACRDIVMYNLSAPSDTITIRVWEHGGIELL